MNGSQSNNHNVSADFAIKTNSVEETLDFGHKLGTLLGPGDVVALVGGLGAGKTWLAKGIAFGLGVPAEEYVNSPAFDIIHEYQGRSPVYHMDFYRIDVLSSGDYTWLLEYIESDGVSIIEWADKFIDQLAYNYLKIDILFSDGVMEDKREIHVTHVGEGYKHILERLK